MIDGLYRPDDFQPTTRSTATRQLASFDGTYKFTEVDVLQEELDRWLINHNRAEFDAIELLTKLAELMETAMDDFLKMDPDPLDDRHPFRTHPHAAYGNLLKALFKREEFMNKLVISYLSSRENAPLCIAAARLLLSCVPGLDSEVIFSEPDDFVPRLFEWARESENETLRAYCMGLLASAMEVQDNASKHRALNAQLITIAIQRLFELKERMIKARETEPNAANRTAAVQGSSPGPFVGVDLHKEGTTTPNESNNGIIYKNLEEPQPFIGLGGSTLPMRCKAKPQENGGSSPPRKKMKAAVSFGSLQDLEDSNTCWSRLQPYVIGKNTVCPLTIEMHQRLILQFLGPTGEYQDLLSLALEGNSMDLILYYIDLENTRDVRFTFDALRYLTSLLVHRKFALEFVARGGVQQLLKVPRLCMASVGAITCFYYLSYNDEVMEKVCQLEGTVLDDLVDYAVWCLEHSYESGRASAAMFFTHAFSYKAVLQLFDHKDGLRNLYNYITTLAVLVDPPVRLPDEMMHTSFQTVRNASASFRSYVTSHLYVKMEQLKKSCKALPQYLKMPLDTIAPHKLMDMPEGTEELAIEVLTTTLKIQPSGWRPVEHARELGMINSMFNILEYLQEWNEKSGRGETLRNTLEVIWMCSAVPAVRMDYCKLVENSTIKYSGFRMLTSIIDNDWYEEDNVQHNALKTVLNCVQSNHMHKGSFRLDIKKTRLTTADLDDVDKKIWECLRGHNIIMILNNVVRQTQPALEADYLRDLCCRCMLGLSRSEEVRQILSKLPLIADNELQGLMKIPVAQDKKIDHIRFCKSAKELIETVTQKPVNDKIPDPKDLTQEHLWKAFVVSNTHITYNEKELLQLIHGHLIKKGLNRTASELIKEAELPDVPASRVSTTPAKLQPLPNILENSGSNREFMLPGPSTPSLYANSVVTPKKPYHKTPVNKRLFLKTPASGKSFVQSPVKRLQPYKGLDDIVTDYFRQQHSNCTNPVTTCPPFSLFFPHQCPEPRSFGAIPYNIVKRFNERPNRASYDLRRSLFHDEKYAFSRFRPSKTFSDQDETHVSCTFSVDDEHLIVGMFTGDVFWINVETGNEDSHTVCHPSGVSEIETARDGSMLLTSTSIMPPLSSVWRLRETQEHLYDLPTEQKVKFANLNHEKILGTGAENGKATIFDTETSRALCVYQYDSELGVPRYQKNAASFSPDDTLILSDGIVWDVRDSSKPIHVLDKLNLSYCGVFHPHGNEIVVNSEVWDVRTFRLVHTVPALNMCNIKFNSTGNIIYAIAHADDDVYHNFNASFRTFDAKDYSVITTVDTKRTLLDIACSHSDQIMAVIERRTTAEYFNVDQTTIRLFEIGKKRDMEDDLDQGEEDNDDGDRGDDESDSLSVTSDSLDGEDIGVFGALRNFENGDTSEASLTDEEDSEDSENEDGISGEDGSDGWETVSGDDNDDNNDFMPPPVDVSSSDDEPEDDDDYDEPQPPMEHPSSSVVALNPHIRRQKRRHNDSGGNR